MRVPSIVGALSVIVLAAALGCGPKPATQVYLGSFDSTCSMLWPHGESADTVTVALFDPVDPRHAPVWQNDAERLVFRHLYEPCEAEMYPCTPTSFLIESDEGSGPGGGAMYTLRNRRFWDGEPVTTKEVVASLRRGVTSNSGIDSIFAIDDKHFEIDYNSGSIERWTELPAFSVTKQSETPWPTGTGLYRVVDEYNMSNITLRPWRGGRPVIRFVNARGTDPRGILDPSFRPRIDFAILNDRAAIEYARSLGRFEVVELSPTRAYVLLTPCRVAAFNGGAYPEEFPDDLRVALAGDAIRGTYAEPFAEETWSLWLVRECVGRDRSPARSLAPRIMYDSTDPTARDLAERISSLAAGDPAKSTEVARLEAAVPGLSGSAPISAVGLGSREFAVSLSAGQDLAYVVGLPFTPLNGSESACALLRSAPWLSSRVQLSNSVIPLVVTKPSAVIAKKSAGFGFDLRRDDNNSLIIIGLPDESERQ